MEKRLKITSIFTLLILAAFLIKLVDIQIINNKKYIELSKENYMRAIKIPGIRGNIYDVAGRKLAGWRPIFRVSFLPDMLDRKKMSLLFRVIGMDTSKLDIDSLRNIHRYISLKQGIDFKKITHIEENISKFPGIMIDAVPARSYNKTYKVISPFLGYVSQANKEEIQKKHLDMGDMCGKSGIEFIYDSLLRGRNGKRFYVVDSKGLIRQKDPIRPIPPVKGKSLYLSIDASLTAYIDTLMKNYKKAACVVYNPRNGRIISIYTKPYFNSGDINEKYDIYASDSAKPLLNRPIQGLYPPGSIFKLLSTLVALSTENVTASTRFRPCTGTFKYGDRTWKCWLSSGHGSLDLLGAIEQSCDIYFYQLGLAVGLKKFLTTLKSMHIPVFTGIDLPGERSGFIPDYNWYIKNYGKYNVTEGYILNLVIGQGEVLLTPIDIALITGIIANKGWALKPHIVLDSGDKDTFRINLPDTIFDIVRQGMWRVVNGQHGTGKAAKMDSIYVAGKTGTAQNPHGKDHALFTCFAPFEKPEYVVTVVVENAGHGGSVAAPIAGKIMKRLFK